METKPGPHVRLWPENEKRINAILKKLPVFGSANKVANTVLAFSLHRFEKSAEWLAKDPNKPL
jgi:hypothetical protein